MQTTLAASSSLVNNSRKREQENRKTRVSRRRARARVDGIDSEDEIERAARSDVSDSDGQSISASDSEPESDDESDVLDNDVQHVETPITVQSPPATVAPLPMGEQKSEGASLFTSGFTWSEMVTDEALNGDAGLPVIDFSDIHQHIGGEAPLATAEAEEESQAGEDNGANISPKSPNRATSKPNRPNSQSARQVYQQRLQTDPSFVPTVGEFWSHDDRLLQKDLRSLSGWWRGRWQGRGRGRGMMTTRGVRGRGRGGIVGHSSSGEVPDSGEQNVPPATEAEVIVPPIERTWTHDGFEEMKAKDAKRRVWQNVDSSRGSKNNTRGGRGGFVGAGRGAPSPRGKAAGFSSHSKSHGDRPWFAMKPERAWTKQHEGFLYFDPATKPKAGDPPAFRVSLPGAGNVLVTSGTGSKKPNADQSNTTDAELNGRSSFSVRLPKSGHGASTSVVLDVRSQEPPTTVEAPPLASPPPPDQKLVANLGAAPEPSNVQAPTSIPHVQERHIPDQANTTADGFSLEGSTIVADLSTDGTTDQERKHTVQRASISSLPPIQTVFPPVNQPSPTFGSPYGYPPPLPPGVALNQQGFAYEIATGRPVYLHPTPPPVHVYDPRPIPHSHHHHHGMPFVPGHLHQPSMSPDFLSHSNTPPINGFADPVTGAPLFSFPRPSGRIEIRAPTDAHDGKGKSERRPSNLRSYVSAEPFQPIQAHAQSSAATHDNDGSQNGERASTSSHHIEDPQLIAYAPYPHYYYPEQYAYPPYVEMPPQPSQYNTYSDSQQRGNSYY